MADSKEYVLDGYRFNSAKEYEQAKRELNRISDIKSERTLKAEDELREIYDSFVESKEFITPIGIGFLREIQRKLARNSEQRKTLKAIPVLNNFVEDGLVTGSTAPPQVSNSGGLSEKTSTSVNREAAKEFNKTFTKIEKLNIKIKTYRIIMFFLAIMVLVPFGIVIYDKVSVHNENVKFLDEYAAWKEELQKKEQELREKERELKIKETDKNSNISGGNNGESQSSGS